MRALLFAAFLAVATWTAGASAQFGLYGSPDMIDLPQAGSALLPASGNRAVPASYSSSWTPRPAPYGPVYPAAQPVTPQPGYAPATQPAAPSTYPVARQPAYGPAMPAQGPPQAAHVWPNAAYAQPNPAYGTPTPVEAPAVPEAPLHSQPAPTSNMVDQMLKDPAAGGVYGNCGTDGSPIAQAACGECGPGDPCPWYASVAGLALGRNEANPFFWSANAVYSPEQCGIVHLRWGGGIEVRFGRRFCCCPCPPCDPCDPCDPGGSFGRGGWPGAWALEGTYWTVVNGFTGERVCRFPGGVVTPIMLDNVQFYNTPADQPMATQIIDGAVEHRIRRYDEVHNVEINLYGEGMLCDPYRPLDVSWGIGVRYFRFDEHLLFAALHQGTWGADPTQEAYINIRDENNLIGGQFTVDLNYYLRPNWRVFFTPRVGIYDNHIEQRFEVYRGDGVVARSTDPNLPGSFPIRSRTDVVAFLTQLDVGVNWSVTRNWGVALGYRAVVATGIGLADNQVPPWLVDMPEIANIDDNGDLVLHGAFVGVTYNF